MCFLVLTAEKQHFHDQVWRQQEAVREGQEEASRTGEAVLAGALRVSHNIMVTVAVILMSSPSLPPSLCLQQVSFWVASPSLPLRIFGKNGKVSSI